METSTFTSPADARIREAYSAANRCTWVYGALATAALVTVVAMAVSGHPVTTFMWIRAALLPVVAVVLHRLIAAGSRRAFDRLRTLAAVLPIAIIGVDLIPGLCPAWYVALQAACMLPVVRLALLTRFSALRSAFPTAR
jgi:hypothetical protein